MAICKTAGDLTNLSQKDFSREGLKITERIYQTSEDGGRKLVWCLTPFDRMEVDGGLNQLVHSDYQTPDPKNEAKRVARRRVAERFLKLHALSGSGDTSAIDELLDG